MLTKMAQKLWSKGQQKQDCLFHWLNKPPITTSVNLKTTINVMVDPLAGFQN